MVEDESEEDDSDPDEGLSKFIAVALETLHNPFKSIFSWITSTLPEDLS